LVEVIILARGSWVAAVTLAAKYTVSNRLEKNSVPAMDIFLGHIAGLEPMALKLAQLRPSYEVPQGP